MLRPKGGPVDLSQIHPAIAPGLVSSGETARLRFGSVPVGGAAVSGRLLRVRAELGGHPLD